QTTYTYDNMDQVQTRTDPLGRQELYTYDANGNVTSFTDRRGKVTNFQYDHLDRSVFVGFGATGSPAMYESTTNYTYDVLDRLIQASDSISGNITRAYDDTNSTIAETTAQGSLSRVFDAAGHRTSMTVAV